VYQTWQSLSSKGWCATKMSEDVARARRWSTAIVTTKALGGIGVAVKATRALPRAVGAMPVRRCGVAIWLQTRQHQALASAYCMAANELAFIHASIPWR
jgi:hypothetical protein